VSYVFQIKDPEGLEVTVQVPGKYNPDILEDGKRRIADLYREALTERLIAAKAQLELEAKFLDDITEEESEDEEEEAASE
jgi:hypothetical protein